MRIGVVVLLALGLSACGSVTDPDGLVVTIDVAPRTFRVGTPASVTMTVTNRGFRPQEIQTNWCEHFDVTTPSGELVGPFRADCDGSSNPRTLLRFERMVFRTTWDGNTWGPELFSRASLPPGEYLVRGSIGRMEGPSARSRAVPVTLTP